MFKQNKNRNTLRNTLIAAMALSVNAYAQEGMDEDYGIDEIIVTSTKRETSLMETAVAVSAFGQESLDNQGVKNLLDIGDMVPNMQIALSPTDSGVQVVVRGLTSNNFTEIGDPTVAMHFDGLYSPRPQAGLALMYDVERVEISRGPQGTLFGRNSTAGSVNVISARPNFDQQEGKIEVEMGKYAQRTVKGWFNLPVNDVLALRASFLKETADTWYNQTPDLFDLAWDTDGDGTTTGIYDVAADGIPNVDQRRNREVSDSDAYGSVDRSGARLGMRFEPTNDVSLDLIADYFQDKSPGGLSLKDCEKAEGTFFACEQDQYDVSVNVPGEMDMTMLGLRSVLTWDINEDVVFEGRVGYSQQKRSQVHDASTVYADPDHPAYGIMRTWYDGNSAPDGCTGGNGSMVECPNLVNNLPLLEALGYGDVAMQPFSDLSLSTNYSDYRSVVSELQLKSQSDSNLQWIAGVFYMKEDNEIRFDVEDPFCCGVIIPLAQSFVQPERLVESLAGFVQFDYKVNEKLNVTAGYRYTHDTKEDIGGRNYITAGYRQPNVGLYDPANPADQFWLEAWTRLGITPTASLNPYQSDVLNNDMGTSGDGFLDRLQYSDNSHKGAWSKGTWKVGFDYLVNDDLFLYGSVATGYKSGGFGDSVDICDCNITDTFDYDPENNITYELGFKATMLDGKLNLLGNVFVMDNTDLQDTFYATITGVGTEIQVPADYIDSEGRTSVCTTGEGDCVIVGRDIGTLITQNIGETRNMGVELEFDWRPYNGGRVNGWVAWLDSEITELDNSQDNWFCLERALLGLTNCPDKTTRTIDGNDIEGRYQSFIGNAMPWSPEYSATVTYEHNWYLHNGMRLSPIVSAHWQDEMFFDKGNFDEGALHSGQDAYATADVALRLINEESAWAVELYVRNVTDEVVRNWADRGPGFMRASLGKPRHYGIKFNMAF
jgi:iron complex outermembrane receptor protein